jgi:3-deoxy-D-manno-octulosonate 8-phosphate phosphatase (KDO 8-P phosphatase)
MIAEDNAAQAARQVKMVVFDVDGTLTDGHIYMGSDGEAMKSFSARDGMGIALMHKAGLKSAIITGRQSKIVENRANELKISAIWQGCSDKRQAYIELKEKFSLTDAEVAYVGDDLNDLPLLLQAGLSCAVGDAMEEVKQHAAIIADHNGGNGAVRDIIEYILKQQGKWDSLVESFVAKPRVDELTQ